MVDKIRLLPDTVANQIAAGEVVNRPASVVKEMVENAVDAGAHCVTVSYRNGGKELIRITDDGEGMSPTDARLAFDKHATSKITQIEDVYKLHTFGFRGEALASIAAISHVELLTRREDDELGTRIEIEGSRFIVQEPAVTPAGSQFSVKNLFYNVPARRRVLDTSTTEHRHIAEEFRRVALCHPGVSFILKGEDALIYNLPASNLKQRVVGLMGKSISNNLLEVSTDTSIVRIRGFTGRPAGSKQSNREQYLFVNGRFFKSPYLHKAVLQAYEKLIPSNTQPSYFLYLEVDPDKVDVNIHPQKIEVRFEEGTAIWQIINAAVREALAKTGAVSLMDFDEERDVEIPTTPPPGGIAKLPRATSNPYYNPFAYTDNGMRRNADISDFTQPYGDILSGMGRDRALERFDESVLEFIEGEEGDHPALIEDDGKDSRFRGALPLAGGYLATSLRGKLVVIDLRRAKEALLYDRYITMLGNETSVSQRLLFPESMAFSNDDASLLKENHADFAALGFEYSVRKDGRVEILGIPADFRMDEIQSLIYDMIDCIREETARPEDIRRRHLAAIMSRSGSGRLSKSYTEGEIEAILELLGSGGHYNYTPDGRAVMAEINFDQLRKFFSR